MYIRPAATGMTMHTGRAMCGAVRVTTIEVREPTSWPAVAPVCVCVCVCVACSCGCCMQSWV